MRTLLRLLAVAVVIAVIGTILLVGRFWSFDRFKSLIDSGSYGYVTIFCWLVVVVAGPFAAVQVWRMRRSGLITCLILTLSTFLYYTVGWLFYARAEADHSKLLLAIGCNVLLALLLISPPARHACSK
jgi:hypothetical protein